MRAPGERAGRLWGIAVFRTVRWPARVASLLVVLCAGVAPSVSAAADDRANAIDCEALVQATYWDLRHEGKGEPFPLDRYRDVLAARADRTARQVTYLRAQRGRDFTAVELQVEIDRLARDTRAPKALGKLFQALGNDAQAIGECLVKPLLADRLARQYFSRDAAIHGRTELAALDALAAAQAAKAAPAGEAYAAAPLIPAKADERLANPATTVPAQAAVRALREFNVAEWQVAPDSAHTRWSRLVEAETEYRALRGDYRDGQLELRTLRWPKQGFDAWWSDAAGKYAPDFSAKADARLVLPQLAPGEIASWSPMRDEDSFLLGSGWYHRLVVGTGSEVIVWGAHGQVGVAYNPTTDTWRELPTLGAPSYGCGDIRGLWTGTKLLVLVGKCRLPQESGSDPLQYQPMHGALYDPVADSWQAIAAPPMVWPPAGSFSAVWTGTKAIYFGGYVDYEGSMGESLATGATYDPVANTWSGFALNPASPDVPSGGFAGHQALWTGTTMLVLGGQPSDSYCTTGSDGFALNPSTGAIAMLPPRPAGANLGLGRAHWTGSAVLVYAPTGYANCTNLPWNPPTAYRGALRYTPATNAWTLINATGDPQSTGASVWAGNNRLVVWGGDDYMTGNLTQAGAIYRADTDTWTPMSTTGAPRARRDHFAATVGNEVVFLGGNCDFDSTPCGDGGRFNPITNSWRGAALPPPRNGPPTSRERAAIAGSGTELYVWGGLPQGGGGNGLTDGRIYDSLTDTWSAMNETGAPSVRVEPFAVFASGKFVVWGGETPYGEAQLGDGKTYDPVARTWTAMPTPGLDLARTGTARAWDGSRLIAWGGSKDGIAKNDGARYDPATNAWATLSATNAPSARVRPLAIGEGGKTLFWRGADGATGGAVYTSATDTWAPVPENGSFPAGTHEAGEDLPVWLGTRFGVLAQDATPNALYKLDNATTGQWLAASTLDGPEGPASNKRHALWTGKRLLVWGMAGGNWPSEGTGWLYHPTTDSWGPTPRADAPASWGSMMARVGGMTAVWGGNYRSKGSLWHEDTRTGALAADLRIEGTLLESTTPSEALLALTTTNLGPEIATGVVLSFQRVQGVAWVGQEGEADCQLQYTGTDTVRCVFEQIAPGTSRTVTLSAQLSYEGPGIVQASVHGSGAEADPVPGNNALSFLFPEITIGDASILEGNSGTKQLVFTATLSQAATFPVRFDAAYDTAYGAATATAGSDFVAAPITDVTIPAGQLAKTFTVAINGDTTVEPNEWFRILLANVVGAKIPWDERADATIVNDDGPLLSISDASVVEGDTGSRQMNFTVTLSTAAAQAVTFNAGAGNAYPGTATMDFDYAHTYNAYSIPAGELTKTVSVTVHGDTAIEGNETLTAVIEGASGASILDAQGTGTIVDDDDPRLSIGDVAVTEGHAGTKTAVFTVQLSRTAPHPVTFDIATTGAGSAGVGTDYVARSLTGQTIAAGNLSQTFAVTINGDTAIEANENFVVVVGNVAGAIVADGAAAGTITNDDFPTLSIGDATVVEGQGGARQVNFTVTLSQPVAYTVMFGVSSNGTGSATSGVDYVPLDLNNVSIPAGQLSRTFAMFVNGDTTLENNETYVLVLDTLVGATMGDGAALGTITNDDFPVLTIADRSVVEGNTGTKGANFTVTLSQPAPFPVYFKIATGGGGSATAGTDYTALSLGGQSIAAGATSKVFPVTINGDTTLEGDESYVVAVTNVTGATVGDGSALGTIVSDDLPSLSIGDVAITETHSGIRQAVFTVTLSQPVAFPVAYTIATTGQGTATAGVDYAAVPPTRQTIAAGASSRILVVMLNGDTTPEPNETYVVALSAPSGATFADGSALGTIVNDD
jgi:N-acetylneuraminic acid mutarotase